jgi:hypothetical protein
MSTITTQDGTQIYYKDWGEGQPLVFSHGWPLSSDAWESQMYFLAQNGYRTIAHDRRGHGRSDQPSGGNDMDTYADDRGGALGGEADVFIINSTIARNAAVAHVAGGIFSRGNLYVANSTVSNNYAEGEGGGILGGAHVRLEHASILNNVAPVAANVGAGEGLQSYASVIGPARITNTGGHAQPTERNCDIDGGSESFGHNFVTDASCDLGDSSDMVGEGDPLLRPLADNGGFGETLLPEPGSPVVDRLPTDACGLAPFETFLEEGDQHLEGLVDDRPALMAKDQRGVDRPQGQACDIGAVELGP